MTDIDTYTLVKLSLNQQRSVELQDERMSSLDFLCCDTTNTVVLYVMPV